MQGEEGNDRLRTRLDLARLAKVTPERLDVDAEDGAGADGEEEVRVALVDRVLVAARPDLRLVPVLHRDQASVDSTARSTRPLKEEVVRRRWYAQTP